MTTSCCSTTDDGEKRRPCPSCANSANRVPEKTILHHLKVPWKLDLGRDPLYFCDKTACDFVYFSSAGRKYGKDEVRTEIGQKRREDSSSLCYCFDVSYGQALRDPGLKDFVIKKTSSGECACEVRNPSGRCCLADFPKERP